MSLRRYLLTGIAIVLVLVGAVTVSLGGFGMRQKVHALLDQHLIQIASLAINTTAAEVSPARSEDRSRARRSRNSDTALIVQRWDGDVVTSLLPHRPALPRPVQQGFSDLRIAGRDWRSYALQTDDGWVAVAQPAEARGELVHGAIVIAILPLLLALLLIGWVLAKLIGRALQGLQELAQSLEKRPPLSMEPLPTHGFPEETQPLLAAFNRLLTRVNTAVMRERDFVTDAAHALRTPITVLQLQAESLQEARTRADYGERLRELIVGISRGRHTVEQLLTLARAEQRHAGTTNIRAALAQLPERFNSALSAKNLALVVDFDLTEVNAAINPHGLNIVVDNLLDNAIRYSPPDETIKVTASISSDMVCIAVRDYGPGLSAHEIEKVFDRFYRPSDDTTIGSGLGLAIVRTICEAAGGRAWLECPKESSGIRAVIALPMAS